MTVETKKPSDAEASNERMRMPLATMMALLLAALLCLCAGPAIANAAPANEPSTGSSSADLPATASAVRFVHGLRGVIADVYFDGAIVIQTFSPDRSSDWLTVTPGTHTIEVRIAGSLATSAPMLSGVVNSEAGQAWSIVLGLESTGVPAISQFLDDRTPVPAGQIRIVVRHVAAAPPIDVFLNENPIATDLANPNEVTQLVAAGTYQVAVTQTGTTDALAPLQNLPLDEGTSNDMYLVGDKTAGTLGWIAVQMTGLQTAPARVQTGDSGLADPAYVRSTGPVPMWRGEFSAVGLLFVGVALILLPMVRRRARS